MLNMCCKPLSIFIGYLVVVNSFQVPKNVLSKSYDLAEEYSIEPLGAVDPSAWSEVVVIQMHYDCRGFLMRQEVSRLRTRSGVARVPGEDLYKAPYKTMTPAYNKEILDRAPEPVYFRSMRKRFRTPLTTQQPAQERPVKGKPIQERLDEGKPSQERLNQQANPENIGPDTIIGVPIRPCPEGQNDDFTGKCKEVFPEGQLFK